MLGELNEDYRFGKSTYALFQDTTFAKCAAITYDLGLYRANAKVSSFDSCVNYHSSPPKHTRIKRRLIWDFEDVCDTDQAQDDVLDHISKLPEELRQHVYSYYVSAQVQKKKTQVRRSELHLKVNMRLHEMWCKRCVDCVVKCKFRDYLDDDQHLLALHNPPTKMVCDREQSRLIYRVYQLGWLPFVCPAVSVDAMLERKFYGLNYKPPADYFFGYQSFSQYSGTCGMKNADIRSKYFTYLKEEHYKMFILHENPLEDNVIDGVWLNTYLIDGFNAEERDQAP